MYQLDKMLTSRRDTVHVPGTVRTLDIGRPAVSSTCTRETSSQPLEPQVRCVPHMRHAAWASHICPRHTARSTRAIYMGSAISASPARRVATSEDGARLVVVVIVVRRVPAVAVCEHGGPDERWVANSRAGASPGLSPSGAAGSGVRAPQWRTWTVPIGVVRVVVPRVIVAVAVCAGSGAELRGRAYRHRHHRHHRHRSGTRSGGRDGGSGKRAGLRVRAYARQCSSAVGSQP